MTASKKVTKEMRQAIQPPPPTRIGWWARLSSAQEIETFLDTLTILLDSGMGIVAALEAIKLELHSPSLRMILRNMQDDIDTGLTLWRALEKSGLLPPQTIALLRLGEESGRLPENLAIVVAQQRKEREFRAKFRSAMIYPAIVFGLTLVIGLGIAWFLLPKLATVFARLQIELPLITRVMIGIGAFLNEFGLIAVPAALLFTAGIVYIWFIHPSTKWLGELLLMNLALTKRLIQEVEIARLCFILGTLLEAGIPVENALVSLAGATNYEHYQSLYRFLQKQVEEGKSFRQSFQEYHGINALLPIPVQQLIAASEQSGRLSTTLLKLAAIYEQKTELTTKNLATIFEPILLIIIWVGVVLLAVSVILPIYSLIGNLNQ